MKRMRRILYIFCLIAAMSLCAGLSAQAATKAKAKASSEKKEGWVRKGKKTFYYQKGKKVKGFQKIKSHTYYFDKSGVMQTGWQEIDGKKYYFDEKGIMAVGLTKIGKKTYFFGPKGVMKTGWRTIRKKNYYFKKNGVMTTGWKTIDGKKYYFDSSGVMATGRKVIGEMSYYFNQKTGVMNPAKTKKRPLSKLEKLCDSIVKQKVKSSDSDTTKLSKLFDYVTWSCSYSRSYGFSAYKDWHKDYAYRMLTNKAGNCYSYGAAFAYLAKKATGLPVRVGWGSTPALGGGLTPHGWCEVKIKGTWYVYDPDLYRFVYPGECKMATMGSVGYYYYNRHYAEVSF